MTLAGHVAEQIESFRPDAVFIDSGCGGGVIDRLRQLGFSVCEVNFGGVAAKPLQYANKRAEMWGNMADWIRGGGALPNLPELKSDLCQPRYDFDPMGKLRLESKEKIKSRCGKSPDLADALALTFAFPVQAKQTLSVRGGDFARTEYDPL